MKSNIPAGSKAPTASGIIKKLYLGSSVAALALALGVADANAQCAVTVAGSVDCNANTATTNTTNTNGATAASSDRIQEFNNGSNITGTIQAGVTVSDFGLNLLLSNAGGNNTISVTNSGAVTTNQNVNALQLNGNGGLITYTGAGTVSNTGTGDAVAEQTPALAALPSRMAALSAAGRKRHHTTTGSGTTTIDGTAAITGSIHGVSATATVPATSPSTARGP